MEAFSLLWSDFVNNSFDSCRKNEKQLVRIAIGIERDDLVEVLIKDNGSGIPRDVVDRIFDNGFSTKRSQGIGLYHAKKLLEEYSSKIEIHSTSALGTIFRLEFPVHTTKKSPSRQSL